MIALFSEVLANFPSSRAKALAQTTPGGIECVYALVWPNYEPPTPNNPLNNRVAFSGWRDRAGLPLWAWVNVSQNQVGDAAIIAQLDTALNPDGWLLDIEGKWVETAKLTTIITAAVATGKPVRVSFAGVSASHVNYDYRTCDKLGATVDWQAYFDSGEGPSPAEAVTELWQSSFVIPGWSYRHRMGTGYGWAKIVAMSASVATIDSSRRAGVNDGTFKVGPRAWGATVADRNIYRQGVIVGKLMGRMPYTRIRVTLDVTRGAAAKHTLSEWTAIAASAKAPGQKKRPVSVYLAEVCPDEVIHAIGLGAA